MFSGGGSHYVGMGQHFYASYDVFRSVFSAASDILGMDLRKLCFETDARRLSAMDYSQIAIYTVSVGMYRVFETIYGDIAGVMAGHSLGEYSALTCAGVLRFEDGLRAVQKRGELLDRVGRENDGRMMAVNGWRLGDCEELLGRLQFSGAQVYLSNHNSPRQFIFSGNASGIEQAERAILAAGGQSQVLPIPTCSHCPVMAPAVGEYTSFLAAMTFYEGTIPVYSNVTGSLHSHESHLPTLLSRHLISSVQWETIIRGMADNGTELYIEMGPQAILRSINEHILEDMPTVAFDDPQDRHLIDSYFKKIV